MGGGRESALLLTVVTPPSPPLPPPPAWIVFGLYCEYAKVHPHKKFNYCLEVPRPVGEESAWENCAQNREPHLNLARDSIPSEVVPPFGFRHGSRLSALIASLHLSLQLWHYETVRCYSDLYEVPPFCQVFF